MSEDVKMRIEDLDTPVLMIEAAALERNIARMKALAQAAGIAYRPHAKSHKSPLIAAMQIAAGANGPCAAKRSVTERI